MIEDVDGSIILTPAEWANILELFKNERSWTETEVLEAIRDGGWMDVQKKDSHEWLEWMESQKND